MKNIETHRIEYQNTPIKELDKIVEQLLSEHKEVFNEYHKICDEIMFIENDLNSFRYKASNVFSLDVKRDMVKKIEHKKKMYDNLVRRKKEKLRLRNEIEEKINLINEIMNTKLKIEKPVVPKNNITNRIKIKERDNNYEGTKGDFAKLIHDCYQYQKGIKTNYSDEEKIKENILRHFEIKRIKLNSYKKAAVEFLKLFNGYYIDEYKKDDKGIERLTIYIKEIPKQLKLLSKKKGKKRGK